MKMAKCVLSSSSPFYFPHIHLNKAIASSKTCLLSISVSCCLTIWPPYEAPLLAMPSIELVEEQPSPVLDLAKVLSSTKGEEVANNLRDLERQTGWKLRILTRSGGPSEVDRRSAKELWKPDDRTIVIIEDVSAPNILNFSTGQAVSTKLPRQFFGELQSRYGNQFFVGEEGKAAALLRCIDAITQCLRREEGCRNVPGLIDDLYYLTLATSIAGGCVFGFASRLPPSRRVEAPWQWVLILSPLWLLLFVSFGILPVVGRSSDWEPLVKNTVGFLVGSAAIYLTPVFGPSPISKISTHEEDN